MTRPRVTVACTIFFLLLAGTVLRLQYLEQAGAAVIDGHPDFERTPAGVTARHMGNEDELLGADGEPVFTGDGGTVAAQWRESDGRHAAVSAMHD